MKNLKVFSLFATFLFAIALTSIAQDVPEHRLSPVVIEHTTIGDTYIKVVYGKPFKRNRAIFGELVPYNEVWRTGANEATEITLTSDIEFGGEALKAGTYSLFTIPAEESWTVIVSKQLGQWGSYSYDDSKDVFRFEVPVKTKGDVTEGFTIKFAGDGSALNMAWDRTAVSIPIAVR